MRAGVLRRACELERVPRLRRIADVDLGSGTVTGELEFREGLFYQILSERTGFSVENDGQLLRLLTELAAMKREYDKISAALGRGARHGLRQRPCLRRRRCISKRRRSRPQGRGLRREAARERAVHPYAARRHP